VLVDRRDGGVVIVTLNEPDKRNAMSAAMTASWTQAMATLGADSSVRCVVVTGAGSAFCAGGDLSWIAESPELTVTDLRERMSGFYRSWLAVRDVPVPTIAAVNGPAIGAGLCLALACDVRYAERGRASFSAPFVTLGMHPGMAASWLLPEAVGLPRARELLFTGRRLDAAEALALGLVHGVAEGPALDEALRVADRIAAAAPIAVRLTKAALASGGHRSIDDALNWEALAQPVTLVTDDLREGIAAARERRPARFTGR
jgi:enoyl-CoA hydratase